MISSPLPHHKEGLIDFNFSLGFDFFVAALRLGSLYSSCWLELALPLSLISSSILWELFSLSWPSLQPVLAKLYPSFFSAHTLFHFLLKPEDLSSFFSLTWCLKQLTNTIQKRLSVSSTQLLYQSAPFQAAILFVSGPFLDQCLTKKNVFAYKYSPVVLVCSCPLVSSYCLLIFSSSMALRTMSVCCILQAFIILSCLISVSVNFSTFLVIGKTSPVTYQVLGHLKTCLVLGFGYTLLHDPFTERNLVGILIAIAGMGLYSYFCTQEGKKKQDDLSLGSQVCLSLSKNMNKGLV